MNITLNDRTLRQVMNLKKLNDKEKDKLVSEILGDDYTPDQMMSAVNTKIRNKYDKNMTKDAFLNNLYSCLSGGARLSSSSNLVIEAQGTERHLSIFKRILHAVFPFAFRAEAQAIAAENEAYGIFLNEARASANIHNREAQKEMAKEAVKKDTPKEFEQEFRENYTDEELEKLTEGKIAGPDEREIQINEVMNSSTPKKDLGVNESIKNPNAETAKPKADTSKDEELARKLAMEEAKTMTSSEKDALKQQLDANNVGQDDDDPDISYFDNMSKGEMVETLKGLYLTTGNYEIRRLTENPQSDIMVETMLYQYTKDNKNLQKKMKAFNYKKCDHKKDDPEEYYTYLAGRKTGLPVNDQTAEIITLASFNIKELSSVYEFIKNKPDYEYLKGALTYKLDQLCDETMVNTTYNDKQVQMPAYQAFLIQASAAGNYAAIAQALVLGYTSHERLAQDPKLMANVRDKEARIATLSKVNSMKVVPQVRKNLLHKTSNSYFIDLGPQEHQTSGNGCWSCSLSAILKYQGADFTQKEIRAYKPKGHSDMDDKNVSLARLKDRIAFTVRSTNDQVNTVLDYTELVHKAVPDAVVHQVDVNPSNFKNRISYILNTYKTPVSFTNGAHYQTIVGIEGPYIIYRDSMATNPVYHQPGTDPNVLNTYKNYCVRKIDDFCMRKSEVTFIEKMEDPNKFKSYVKDFHIKSRASVSGDTLFLSREIGPKDEELISVPEELAKTLQIGPFDKKKPEIEAFDDKEIDNEDEFTLLK